MGAREEVKQVTVVDVAREALAASDGDAQKAAQWLAKRVRKDPDLYRELLDGMVETACYTAVSGMVRSTRAAIWTPPNHDAGGNGERVKALAAGNALMFFPLPGGKLLAQATRAEVEDAANFYAKLAADTGHKARWLALVAKRIDGRKTVQTCLTEQELAKLQEQADAT